MVAGATAEGATDSEVRAPTSSAESATLVLVPLNFTVGAACAGDTDVNEKVMAAAAIKLRVTKRFIRAPYIRSINADKLSQ
jgi:hypothetical protein